jgi:hypothetical protein
MYMFWPSFSNPPFHVHGIGRGEGGPCDCVGSLVDDDSTYDRVEGLTLPDEYMYLARPNASVSRPTLQVTCKLAGLFHPASWTSK